MQENAIVVTPVNGLETVRHLLIGAKEHNCLIDQLCDIYGMAVIMADYDVKLQVPANVAGLETILQDLTHANYVSSTGEKIVKDKVISVHLVTQQKQLLVRIMVDGEVHVFSHSQDRDKVGGEFLLEMVRPARDEHGAKLGHLDQRTVFRSSVYDDVIAAITELRLGKYSTRKGAVRIDRETALAYVEHLIRKENFFNDFEGDTLPGTLPVGKNFLEDPAFVYSMGGVAKEVVERWSSTFPEAKVEHLVPDAEEVARGIPLSVEEECLKAANVLTGTCYNQYYSRKHLLPTLTDEEKIAKGIPVRAELPRMDYSDPAPVKTRQDEDDVPPGLRVD